LLDKSKMTAPESESEFVFKMLKYFLSLPFLLITVLLRKKSANEFFKPIGEIIKFVFNSKITLALIIVNIFFYILEIFYFSQEQLKQLAFEPSNLYHFELMPIFSSWFLHASLAHLLSNMLFLFIFGRIVEKELGSFWLLAIYFFSAIISTIVSAFFNLGGIGASGAIAGLISASILLNPFYLTYLILGIPIPIILLGFVAITTDLTRILIPQQFDSINHFAHLGGYLASGPLLFLTRKDLRQKTKRNFVINLLFLLLILGLKYFRMI